MEREYARARALNQRHLELGQMAQDRTLGNDEFQAYCDSNFGDGKGNYPTRLYSQD